MVVPVAFMGSMTVCAVHVVDMPVVGDGDVPASFAVGVVMAGMFRVTGGGAFVPVSFVGGVQVPLVGVVGVLGVRDGDMAAAVTVVVGVFWVLEMGHGRGSSSWECRTVSLTMWPT